MNGPRSCACNGSAVSPRWALAFFGATTHYRIVASPAWFKLETRVAECAAARSRKPGHYPYPVSGNRLRRWPLLNPLSDAQT